jgi:ketosteroid isomerase-like protein
MSDVQTAAELWDATFNSGDTAKLSSFYAPDARVIPAGGAAVFGAEAIGKFFAGLIASGFRGHKITVDKVDEKGPIAIASGKWQLSGPGEGGSTSEYSGNWVNVLERTGSDGWRVLLHTWN